MTGEELFRGVVEASRLKAILAPFAVTRLLVRANVLPKTMTPADLARALPELEAGLRVYLPEDEVRRAIADIRRLAAE